MNNDFSLDGCRTKDDIEYRRLMLKQIKRGYESGRILQPKPWVMS